MQIFAKNSSFSCFSRFLLQNFTTADKKLTHFVSVPCIDPETKRTLIEIQQNLMKTAKNFSKPQETSQKLCFLSNPNLFHLTLCMLSLPNPSKKVAVERIFAENRQKLIKILPKDQNFPLHFDKISCFSLENRRSRASDVIFLQPRKDEALEILHEISHILISSFIESKIVDFSALSSINIIEDSAKKLRMSHFHMTLARVKDLPAEKLVEELRKQMKNSIKIPLSSLDVSTRFEYDSQKFYKPLIRLKTCDNS